MKYFSYTDLNDEECIVLGDRIEHIKSKKKHSDIDENFRKLQIQLANEIQESPLNKETIYKISLVFCVNSYIPIPSEY